MPDLIYLTSLIDGAESLARIADFPGYLSCYDVAPRKPLYVPVISLTNQLPLCRADVDSTPTPNDIDARFYDGRRNDALALVFCTEMQYYLVHETRLH